MKQKTLQTLEVIEENGTVTAGLLAHKLNINQSAATQRLQKLKQSGYIESPRIGRYVMTAKGLRAVAGSDSHEQEDAKRIQVPTWYTPNYKQELQEVLKSEPQPEPKSEPVLSVPPSIDWQTKYFEQIDFMQELLRNLTKKEQ